jgi:23S rRNA (cytidine2498-2'-O)-methyltransferase
MASGRGRGAERRAGILCAGRVHREDAPVPSRDDPPTLLLAAPARDADLADEVARTLPGAEVSPLAPGVLRLDFGSAGLAGGSSGHPGVEPTGAAPAGAAPAGTSLAFAAQVLPDARPLAATSVARWAGLCAGLVLEALDRHTGPWRLHVLAAPRPGSRLGSGRAQLVREQLLLRLKERRRALHRALVVDDALPWAAGGDDVLVQLLLVDLEQGFLSVAGPDARHAWRHVLSRFPAGAVDVPEDRGPPSRAYRKLLEAELHLGQRIEAGQRVVDLGASPGGWSAVALARGAEVLAVDRAPLREDLMAHPRLRFVTGDAFRHAPDPATPADWLLCDVIAFPTRTLELLQRWLAARACRRFVVTLKFRGTEDYARLQECKALLAAHGGDFLLRQLGSNRNEVTACSA